MKFFIFCLLIFSGLPLQAYARQGCVVKYDLSKGEKSYSRVWSMYTTEKYYNIYSAQPWIFNYKTNENSPTNKTSCLEMLNTAKEEANEICNQKSKDCVHQWSTGIEHRAADYILNLNSENKFSLKLLNDVGDIITAFYNKDKETDRDPIKGIIYKKRLSDFATWQDSELISLFSRFIVSYRPDGSICKFKDLENMEVKKFFDYRIGINSLFSFDQGGGSEVVLVSALLVGVANPQKTIHSTEELENVIPYINLLNTKLGDLYKKTY